MTPLISGRLAVATSRAEFKAPNTSGGFFTSTCQAVFEAAKPGGARPTVERVVGVQTTPRTTGATSRPEVTAAFTVRTRNAALHRALAAAAFAVSGATATLLLAGKALHVALAVVGFWGRGRFSAASGRGRFGESAAASPARLRADGGSRGRSVVAELVGLLRGDATPLRSRWGAIPAAVRGVIVARIARLRLLAPGLGGQGTAQAEGQRGRRSSPALAVAGLFVGRLGYRLRASWAHPGAQAALAFTQGHRARFARASGTSSGVLTAGYMLRLRGGATPGTATGAATITAAVRSSGPLLRATAAMFLRVDGSARRLRTRYAV